MLKRTKATKATSGGSKKSARRFSAKQKVDASSQISDEAPLVSVVMGSDSDWKTMRAAVQICGQFQIPVEYRVISAHRTPADMMEYASAALGRGIEVIIAGAGGAAHLPGMLASLTPLPIIGVPIESGLQGLDSLLSIVQMPTGVPVATVAVGNAGNAGLLAVRILALRDADLRVELLKFQEKMAAASRGRKLSL